MAMVKTAAVLAFAAAAFACSGATAEQSWRKLGTLDCTMGPSIGLVYGDRQQARCSFSSSTGLTRHRYIGRVTRPGSNIGVPSGSKLTWSVFSKSPPGKQAKFLLGSYTGLCGDMPSNEKTLSGGSQQPYCLQPLGAGTRRRPNLASDITMLRLE